MAKTHILFVANDVLGWATYARQLEVALRMRDDLRATVLHRAPPRIAMQLARRHADGALGRALRPFDPITMHEGVLGHDIRAAIARHRPDIIHVAAHWPAGAVTGGDIPVTLALDTTRPALTRDLPLPGWSAAEIETEATLCRKAAHLFPMSHWAADSLREDFGIGMDRITIQPPSLDPAQWPPPAGGAVNAVPQILFVGNNLLRKGAYRLADWVGGPLSGQCHLHIVSGDSAPPPKGPHVTCHGPLSNAQLMQELLPRMDLFCLPTRLDMSPFVLVEAAAAGLPVVSSALGGIPDLVEDGVTGRLVAPEDDAGFVAALSALLEDPVLRARMGETARARAAQRFDGRRNFDALIDRLIALGQPGKVAA
ncbi:MAG: glycosyltransferase family 4 protein [Thioclava sp.]|nr:glycosyltransferase family 4 protein [Thioclava sp.]MBD3802316.1 glycosyltransferase family 4 protein [Thioclava sp.]